MGAESTQPIKCGFPFLAAARHQMASLSPEIQSAVRALAMRPVLQTSILRHGYRIHFDTTGSDAPALLNAQGQRIPGTAAAFAESTAVALQVTEAVEIGELGYPSPVQDGTEGGGPEPDIYIMELGSSYGLTNADNDIPVGGRSPSYITVDNDFAFVRPVANRGIPALNVTIAHEFHHLIQIGSYGLWPDDVYYYEITSTWLEDVVYTNVNDYYNYLRSDYSQLKSPAIAFTSNQLIAYSRAIWGHFIAKAYGHAMMRRSWEYVRDRRPLGAIDAALREGGSSFALALAEWTRWNYYTGTRADSVKFYPEGRNYPEVVQVPRDFVAPLTTISASIDPTGARYHQVMASQAGGTTDTLTIAVVNCDVAAAEAASPAAEPYAVALRSDAGDPSFKDVGAGLSASFTADNLSVWSVWFFVGLGARQPFGIGALKEGTPFPNPLLADGVSAVSIPIDANAPIRGDLQIYDVAMNLVYASGDSPSTGAFRQVFRWNGTTVDGRVASTGVYVYHLSLSDGRTLVGKIAVLRR